MLKSARETKLAKFGNIGLAMAIVGVLVAIIIPLPSGVLDVLLTVNITLSVLVLLIVVYTERSLDLAIFPSLLLFTTLFRLSLNVATTRRILLDGEAGRVIEAFGNFVVGGNYVVGAVIFMILVVIQFVVITKGSSRIAEVAARFTLDAMPGKQMAIDADLNTGLITDNEARERRRQIAREADFYGAMDGASKFVRGDAMAGLIITLVNVLGGLAIGVFQRHMAVGVAAQRYTLLTIGDGLVAQIPSLIIATAAGVLVSRAGSTEKSIGEDLTSQLLQKPRALLLTAGALVFFGIMPGLPAVPFLLMAAVAGVIGLVTQRGQKRQAQAVEAEAAEKVEVPEPERVKRLLHVDPMELEIGYGLILLVDASQGGDILDRITMLRREFANELGLVVPPIRIRDNLQLEPNTYRIKIAGTPVAGGELMVGMHMALNAGRATEELQGIPTVEPAFGLRAVWVSDAQKHRAEALGHTVVDAASVLATHVSETIREHAAELLNRQAVQELLDGVKKEYPVLVDELVPNVLSVGQVQRVLQNLLAERVSIRRLPTILEALSDYGGLTKDADVLSEYVRHALARVITQQHAERDGKVNAVLIEPQLEQQLVNSIQKTARGSTLVLDPRTGRQLTETIGQTVQQAAAVASNPVLLVSPTLRLALKRFVGRDLAKLPVLSYSDLTSEADVQSVGLVRLEPQEAMAGV
jgi:flagellar biosynthesis protein FlhA